MTQSRLAKLFVRGLEAIEVLDYGKVIVREVVHVSALGLKVDSIMCS